MPNPTELFALTTVALFVKMLCVAFFQGVVRIQRDEFTRPEDAEAYGDGEAATSEIPVVDRAQRALRNDVENIPIFLFLAWSCMALEVWPAALPVYFGLFVLARIGHTLFYLTSTQPARTIAYAIGVFVNVGLSIHLVSAVLGG